jgi:3-hydroxymyristoyl/3-hydroxydecanoyl-(acyl carrier protein) dehydratase
MRGVGHFTIAPDHPALAGHFPGRPVVPGVVLLDEAFALLLQDRPGELVAATPVVKFLRPVLPGEQVTLRWAAAGGPGSLGFTGTVAEQAVLRGTARLEPVTDPAQGPEN